MGKNIVLENLIERRLILSKKIVVIVDSWNGELESVNDVVRNVDNSLEKLKELSNKISIFKEEDDYDAEYEENLKKIVAGNKILIETLRLGKLKEIETIKKINNFQNNGNAYVVQVIDPMFIDKGL